jgi:type II secretory pathway pseudopilin PulG
MNRKRSQLGVTLVEMSITIAVLILLATVVAMSVQPYSAYRDGRAAGEALRAVKAAMQMYLADNPSAQVSSLTPALLAPYLPPQSQQSAQNNLNSPLPALPLVNGVMPGIQVTSFPPVATLNGGPYDPSPSKTDGLWDVGQ